MRGVVMSVKGRYAVLLNKNGEFVKVRNKDYTIGETVSVTSNAGRICALAASFLVVCGGISSYFIPAGYVSVDINPSFLLTLNIYNKVIDIDALNNDAVILLENADIKGKTTEDTVDILIKTSEEIGYLNENNNDVIVEVVSGIRDVKIAEYSDVEVVVEKAEKSDLRNAKEMGVSIAKAKAIKDYTNHNGGTVKDNAVKLIDKSVKEIRKGLEIVADEILLPTPVPTGEVKVVKVAKSLSGRTKKKPIQNIITDDNKPEGKVEEIKDTVTEIKPAIPVTEIFRTPAPYFKDENDAGKEEKKEENIPSFPNQFMPQLQEKPSGGNNSEENTSKPQKENDKKENVSVKEERPVENDTGSSKSENNTVTGNENSADRQDAPKEPQQSDRTPDNNAESGKLERNDGSKPEKGNAESSDRDSHSDSEPSRDNAPSAPSHQDNGSDRGNEGGVSAPSRGGNDGGNTGGPDAPSHGGNDRGNGSFSEGRREK